MFILIINLMMFFSISLENVYAAERVVVNSLHSDKWYENVYLLANKIDWMTFRNFTVQIGDKGEYIYHFPKWESGKYDTYLFRDDLDGNNLTDVIIVLDHFQDPIHVLNQVLEPYSIYKEIPVEPVNAAVKRLVQMRKKGDIVTINTEQKTYKVNVRPFHYTTAKPPSTEVYVGIDDVHHSVTDHKLIAEAPVLITIGGGIGNLKLTYGWNEHRYEVKSVSFKQDIPKQYE